MPYLFWTACLFTGLVVVDLVWLCSSRRHFIGGWLALMVSVLGLVSFHLSDNRRWKQELADPFRKLPQKETARR